MRNTFVIAAVVLLSASGGWYYFSREDGGEAATEKMEKQEVALAGSLEAPLLDFNANDYEAALGSEKLIVLYFYANWCPICKAEFPKMQDAFNELPDGSNVVGFRINYNDNETDSYEQDIAREFGVAYQHTKVFIKNGERVLKAPDSWEKERYLSEIGKFTN